ncbi:MAG: hypothetical protein HFI10_09285 [Lachnospiraceae bacterium]|jgi:hypothetical protein|nr:hypothetical protein [Lachnospiraceae bacterium]
MNFLWDIVLRAVQQGEKEEDMLFRQAEEYSPFFEQSFPCINEQQVGAGTIELNLLYRFAEIFQEILAPAEVMGLKEGEFEAFRAYFTDAALHELLFTDLRHGLSKRDVYIHRILEELQGGVFWKGAAEKFGAVEYQEQGRLAALLLAQMETGSSLGIFRRAVRILHPEAVLYQMKNEPKKLLLYLSDKKTERKEDAMEFVQDLFLPVGFALRIFWQYHFGVIGMEEAMRMDETALY